MLGLENDIIDLGSLGTTDAWPGARYGTIVQFGHLRAWADVKSNVRQHAPRKF